MNDRLIQKIADICPYVQNVSMKNYTTFKIGGNADVLVTAENTAQLSALLKLSVPYFLLGNGSNLLVGDGGIRGMVIKIGAKMGKISIAGDILYAEAGATLAAAAHAALEAGLGGMEFAAGIPGTIGGAVLMNAGAYDGEMKDIVTETEYLTPSGESGICREHSFSYRYSIFQETGNIITATKLQLYPKDRAEIKAKMEELAEKRRTKQPLTMPSAGSAFKRPKDGFAAKMIDEAGLRGYRIGDAAVSEKHTGFLVNHGAATAKDMRALMRAVQETVQKTHGVLLEPEIRFVGEFL